MLKSLLPICALSFLALTQSCSQANSHGNDYTVEVPEARPKTAAELRAELLQREQSAPQEYLQVQGTHHRNFINQLVLEGDITNQATLALFKDPVLLVTWYSQTQTELGTQQYPIYELVPPQGKTHYKLKTAAPNEVATISIGIAGATAID